MAIIIPFRGIRPVKDKVHLVASRSVDGYSRAELRDKLSGNPYTFLHVINPDFDDGKHTRPGSRERLEKIKEKYLDFQKKEILQQDPLPCYYVYQQNKNGITFTGIMGCSSIDDYLGGVIKTHEQTLADREEKLKEYLEICQFNAEPVLFSYPNDAVVDRLTEKITATLPVYDFTTTDKVRHTLWVVSEKSTVAQIKKQFEKIPSIYIADGHHRSASSALLGQSRRKENPSFTGDEPFNFYLGIFFPEAQLKIYDYNRVVHDLNGLGKEEFLAKLKGNFTLTDKAGKTVKPARKHHLSMYLASKWYSLEPRPGIVHDKEPVGSLDASILTEHLLSPVLGIHDLRTDKRISFVPGIRGMEELKTKVDSGDAVAFGLYPVSMEQLKRIADTHSSMPPKTTWIEPKMRSGLVIYSLEE